MTSDPIKELHDLIHSELLPKILTGPRQSVDENGRGLFGYFAQIKVSCRDAALETWRFLKNWFDSWPRAVLTGLVTGAVIGVVYRWILLPT
jgi:hypothetical protein